jgi:8-amino-7-oxononanoate synthase
LREVLIHDARSFVFSTAPLPVLAAALDAALDVCRVEPERRETVHRKARALRERLEALGVQAGGDGAIVPIVVGDSNAALRLEEALRADGFDARAIRPPTVPEGTARLRLTVRYPVSDADLERLAERIGALTGAQ